MGTAMRSPFHASLVAALARLPERPRAVGSELTCVDETPSTNDLAHAAAAAGCSDGAVFIADVQTAGRGRSGRTWLSGPGDCALVSVVLRAAMPATEIGHLTMLGACAVAAAVESAVGVACKLKWPNDVEVRGRKLAGVLVESSLVGERLDYAVLGIGVNLNLDTSTLPAIRDTATSVAVEIGRPVDRAAFVAELLLQLERRYDLLVRGLGRAIFEEWRDRLSTLGRRVRLVEPDGSEVELEAVDVSLDGALIGRRADGARYVALLGDVTLRPA